MGIVSDIEKAHRRSAKREAIRSDPEKKKKTVAFGVSAIFFEIFTVIVAFGAIFCFSLMLGDNVVFIVLGLLFGIVCGIGALGLFINAIINVCFQLSMNRRAVGFIALVLLFVTLAAIAVIFYILLNGII